MGKSLCYSRVSINLMPLSVTKRLSLGELSRVALIDVKKGELTLKVGDEAVYFNLNHSLK